MERKIDWTSGYVTEVEYTHGYYQELCPSVLRLTCIKARVSLPQRSEVTTA
jgi:hypothetical protein